MSADAETPRRRNVLFLLADQLQAFALGCMGHPEILTPNLDALAAGGTLFTDAYVEFPVCTQYRGVLHTGNYGATTGITQFGTGPKPETRTLAAALNDLGVWTSYVGKWHLYEFFDMAVLPEQRCGFERFVGYQSYNGYYHGTKFWDEDGTLHEFVGEHRTVATADIAIDRLREIPDDRDFAVFVSFTNPHYPLEPLPGYLALYGQDEITLRPNVIEPDSVFTPTWSPHSPRPIETDPNYQRYGRSIADFWRYYAAMVTQLDHEVGRILAELRALNRHEETLVVFTSDHGEMGGSHGRMNKSVWYEEATRVPFIVRSPGSPSGTTVSTPVSAGVDIWPTLIDWLGHAIDPDLPGGSIVSMLDDGTDGEHHPIFSEMAGEHDYAMVRDGRWKYVERRGSTHPIALHDLVDDPNEQNNLLGDADDATGVVDRLSAALGGWRSSVGIAASEDG